MNIQIIYWEYECLYLTLSVQHRVINFYIKLCIAEVTAASDGVVAC